MSKSRTQTRGRGAKEEKIVEAKARTEARALRSDEQQLEHLGTHRALKERGRLAGRITRRKAGA